MEPLASIYSKFSAGGAKPHFPEDTSRPRIKPNFHCCAKMILEFYILPPMQARLESNKGVMELKIPWAASPFAPPPESPPLASVEAAFSPEAAAAAAAGLFCVPE